MLLDRGIGYDRLCGGTKTLLLMRHMDDMICLGRMGPNCYPYLHEITEMKDVLVGVDGFYGDIGVDKLGGREMLVLNDGSTISTDDEFLDAVVKYT